MRASCVYAERRGAHSAEEQWACRNAHMQCPAQRPVRPPRAAPRRLAQDVCAQLLSLTARAASSGVVLRSCHNLNGLFVAIGKPTTTADWTYIEDCARALVGRP